MAGSRPSSYSYSYSYSYSSLASLPRRALALLRMASFHVLLVLRLTVKLIDFLLRGTKTWVVMFIRLLSFAVLLSPGWYQVLSYWFFDASVVRNVAYSEAGAAKRHLLDIYLPAAAASAAAGPAGAAAEAGSVARAPVIVFVSGGAWIIGYKLWSTLVARCLSKLGAIVVVPDYRNFPQSDIIDMIGDVEIATQWVLRHIDAYGGDAEQLTVAGQSAGAHIIMCMLLRAYDRLYIHPGSRQAFQPESQTQTQVNVEAQTDVNGQLSRTELMRIKLVFGVSGPYHLEELLSHLHVRGLDPSILKWVCKNDLKVFSPSLLVEGLLAQQQQQQQRERSDHDAVLAKFPRVVLFHGSLDKSIPYRISQDFACLLQQAGVEVSMHLYKECSHTDPIVEGPLMGNNILLHDMMDIVHSHFRRLNVPLHSFECPLPESGTLATRGPSLVMKYIEYFDDHLHVPAHFSIPLVPRWLVNIARLLNPF